MPDYGRPIQFGYFLVPNADAPLLSLAQEVERLGLDYVAVQDHPYQRRFVDTWVLLITDGASDGVLRGPVDQWVGELTDLVLTYGFDTFILWAEGEGQLSRFAEEVVPAVRGQVAAERT